MRFWDPFRQIEALRREIDRAFHEVTHGAWPLSRVSFLPGIGSRVYPLINVSEDKEAVHVEALAPGIDPDNLEVSIHNGTLTIKGEKKATNGGMKPEAFHRNERAAARFIRTIDLSTEVEEKKVKAEYDEGILTITLPKAEKEKPKLIEVKVN